MSIKMGVGLMEGVIGLTEDNNAEQHIYSLPARPHSFVSLAAEEANKAATTPKVD